MVTGRLRYHFSGIAGAGMAPLALLMRARGHRVQGSDRSLDQGKNGDVATRLRQAGVLLLPQDGRAITADLDEVVYSTAVEDETPEMRAARALGLRCVPRPTLLAQVVNFGQPGVAIAGTSGKSTITGMIAWTAREEKVPATVIGGGALVGEGTRGCLVAGPDGGPAVAEACESDGTLVGYRPALGVLHNVSRDHDELDALRRQFSTFAGQCGRLFVNGRCPEALALGRAVGATSYGASPEADLPLEVLATGPARSRGRLHAPGGAFILDVPHPGLHNLENAAAAALVLLELGLAPASVTARLAVFPGVARRFEVIGTTSSGIRVIDDFAHNAAKIEAAVMTAQALGGRLLAVFQPHGFGPARFLRAELRALLPALLRRQDRFCYAEVHYAGGTVARDVSSADLAADLPAALRCGYAADHDAVCRWIVGEARPGDTVLLMGARDPDLPRLAQAIFEALETAAAPAVV